MALLPVCCITYVLLSTFFLIPLELAYVTDYNFSIHCSLCPPFVLSFLAFLLSTYK